MKVWSIDAGLAQAIAIDLGLRAEARPVTRNAINARVFPPYVGRSKDPILRRYHKVSARDGRTIPHAACFHAFRDYIRALFHFGATRVKASAYFSGIGGDWQSLADFEHDLPDIAHTWVGPLSYHWGGEYMDLCTCYETEEEINAKAGAA